MIVSTTRSATWRSDHSRSAVPSVPRKYFWARMFVAFTLHAEGTSPEWEGLRQTYEHALGLYEKARFDEACRALYPLLMGGTEQDVPSLNLVGRAIEGIKVPPPSPEAFDGVFSFTSK